MPVPHSYSENPNYYKKHFHESQQVVIDPMSDQLGFFKNCQDPDQGVPRAGVANWMNVKKVDFKVYGDPTEQQLRYLQQFLDNEQPRKILHVALYHDASSQWIKSLEWRPVEMVLEVHDYRTDRTMEQKLAEHQFQVERFLYADYHLRDEQYQNLKLL